MSRITESLYSKYDINERKPLRESRKNRKLYERVSYPEDRMIAKNIEWDMDAIKLDKDAFDTEEEYLDFVKSLPNQVDLPKDIAYEYYYEFDDDEEEEAEEFVKDWISEWYGAGYPIKSLNIGERGMMLDSFNKKSSYESCLKEEWLAEDSFNVQDFVSGFVGSTKFKIKDAEDDVFVCSGNILDGKIVNIQDLVINKNKISSLIITSFTIDHKNGTLVLYSYVPDDVWDE